MKKITFLAIMAMAIFTITITGCKQKTDKADSNADSVATNVVGDKDSTMYGTCTAGAMHTLEMKGEDGQIHTFEIDLEDSATVFGGILEGDQMAVTYRVIKGDNFADTIATRVINLSTLEAKWSSLDKNFEIQKGGTVQSHQQGETHPWTAWRIFNGHLVLNKDTFDITRLDQDSLYLENAGGIYAYKRLLK